MKNPSPSYRDTHAKDEMTVSPKFVDIEYVDFKDIELLKRYLNEQGKILPRRVTGAASNFQRQLTVAVKRARHLALLPFVADSLK